MDLKIFAYRKHVFFGVVVFGLCFLLWSQSQISSSELFPMESPRHHNRTFFYSTSMDISKTVEYLAFIGRLSNESSKEKIKNIPFEQHYFNVDASDGLAIDREVPDTRHTICRTREYNLPEAIQSTSVIISYYNEAPSVLIRTILSVLKRTSMHFLHEIILVDDGSTNYVNASFLDNFHSKIRAYRLQRRVGLIRARSIAARDYATGVYLVFLDSHCEVNVGWLEPLLERLHRHPGVAVSPVIDVIDPLTFLYRISSDRLRAAFDWGLQFRWIVMSAEEQRNRGHGINATFPFSSPTVAGGIFAISKKWYMQLGGFDEELEIWGGEALEMSFKVWMCGGQVEIVPCSRVGHIFRLKHPYNFPSGQQETVLRNSKRIAETWMGDYKNLFYAERPAAKITEPMKLNQQIVSVQKGLQCRSFKWYLQNVYQELEITSAEYSAFGELRQAGQCLQRHRQMLSRVSLTECRLSVTGGGIDANQKWILNQSGTLSTDSGSACLAVALASDGSLVVRLEQCQSADLMQKWHRLRGKLVHDESGRCLENVVGLTVDVTPCRQATYAQLWHFSVEIEQLHGS